MLNQATGKHGTWQLAFCSCRHALTIHVCVQPELQGMLPVVGGSFAALRRSALQWPNSLKQCAAVCNSLNLVNRQDVVGDAADFAAFRACEARFLVRSSVGASVNHSVALKCFLLLPLTLMLSHVLSFPSYLTSLPLPPSPLFARFACSKHPSTIVVSIGKMTSSMTAIRYVCSGMTPLLLQSDVPVSCPVLLMACQ